jgi:hypothetical protein
MESNEMTERKKEKFFPSWVWGIGIGMAAIGVAALIIFLGF